MRKTWFGFLLLVVVLFGCVGCGAEAVPGGTAYFNLTRPDGTKVLFKNNKDTSLNEFEADMATGIVKLKGLNSNGSNLGNLQMQWSIVESNNRRAVLGDLISMIRELAPLLGGGGGGIGGIIGGGSGTVADTAADTETRRAIVEKINACPFLAQVPAQQLAYANYVLKAPASMLPTILEFVNRLSLVPVEVPAVKTPRK